jgi:hypothetical protein
MIELIANTTADAIKQINKLRLDNKNKWIFVTVNLNGLNYKFKFYDTWIQIAENPEGRRSSSAMDISVGEFKNYLKKFFEA